MEAPPSLLDLPEGSVSLRYAVPQPLAPAEVLPGEEEKEGLESFFRGSGPERFREGSTTVGVPSPAAPTITFTPPPDTLTPSTPSPWVSLPQETESSQAPSPSIPFVIPAGFQAFQDQPVQGLFPESTFCFSLADDMILSRASPSHEDETPLEMGDIESDVYSFSLVLDENEQKEIVNEMKEKKEREEKRLKQEAEKRERAKAERERKEKEEKEEEEQKRLERLAQQEAKLEAEHVRKVVHIYQDYQHALESLDSELTQFCTKIDNSMNTLKNRHQSVHDRIEETLAKLSSRVGEYGVSDCQMEEVKRAMEVERQRIREEAKQRRIRESYRYCAVSGSIRPHSDSVCRFLQVNLDLKPSSRWTEQSVMEAIGRMLVRWGVQGDTDTSSSCLNILVNTSPIRSVHIQSYQIPFSPKAGWWNEEDWNEWCEAKMTEVIKECICDLNLLILIVWGCMEERIKQIINHKNPSIDLIFIRNDTSLGEITECVEKVMMKGLHAGAGEMYSPVLVGEVVWQSSLVLSGGSYISKEIACESVKILSNHFQMIASKEKEVLNMIESLSESSFMESFYSFCMSDASLKMFA